jgi:nucleoside-diphosphate-sugar epimerase
MAILVTGALGFLGSRLVERLAKDGQDVIAIVRKAPSNSSCLKSNIQWIERDIIQDDLNLSWLPRIDAVVHMAGTKDCSKDSVTPFFVGNEQCSVNLLEEVSKKTDLFILASSQMVYGNTKHLAVTEDFALRPQDSTYGCSKINSENWMRLFQSRNGGRYLALRFCGFIDGGGFVDYLIDQALYKKNIQLYGQGKVRRDYLSSVDGVEALVKAINFSGAEGFMPINVGSGQLFSSLQLAELVCDELNSEIRIDFNDAPPPKDDFVFCINRARELLNFKPSNLSDAVRQYSKYRYGLLRDSSNAKN